MVALLLFPPGLSASVVEIEGALMGDNQHLVAMFCKLFGETKSQNHQDDAMVKTNKALELSSQGSVVVFCCCCLLGGQQHYL